MVITITVIKYYAEKYENINQKYNKKLKTNYTE